MTPYTDDAPGLIQRIADLERQLAAVTAGADQWQINASQAREEADALEEQLAAEQEAREKIAAERDDCEDLVNRADARTALAESRLAEAVELLTEIARSQVYTIGADPQLGNRLRTFLDQPGKAPADSPTKGERKCKTE